MKIVKARLKSVSPLSMSKALGEPKLPNESDDDYERRVWRERMHHDSDGMVFIPPMSLLKPLQAAAQYGSLKIPGERSATYTKHFLQGIFCMEPIPLGVHIDDVPGEWLFLDANGKKGKGSSGRVFRCMPRIDHWEGTLVIHVVDEKVLHSHPENKKITVLEHFLRLAGSTQGVGRFRPERGGFYGRFVVESFEIMEAGDVDAA